MDVFIRTPLFYADREGHESIVKMLLDTGEAKYINSKYTYGETPLLWAAKEEHGAVVRLLESFSSS